MSNREFPMSKGEPALNIGTLSLILMLEYKSSAYLDIGNFRLDIGHSLPFHNLPIDQNLQISGPGGAGVEYLIAIGGSAFADGDFPFLVDNRN